MSSGKTRYPDPIAETRRKWVDHGWSSAADGVSAVISVIRAQQILIHRIDVVLRPLDLTFARYEILMHLSFSDSGYESMSGLGHLLQVHPTSVSSAVDRLETQGLVERCRDSRDGRVVDVRITDDGRARALAATTVLNGQVFEQLGISEHQTDQLQDVLRSLRANAGDF